MKIERSDGITLSEKYLKRLCDKAFLSLWSYSGIYRDQKQGEKGDGKELCDLLVVFENHIIIFSDKHIEFPNSGNIQLDWSRWYRRAVSDSAKQIFGAERWIKLFPNRLFINRMCTQPIPIGLPSLSEAKFHGIVIAHGVAEKCKEFFGGGSGSLIINNAILGDQHVAKNCQPFTIGQINPIKGFVHVFDDISLDILLEKLDTVVDFVRFLEKKEKIISNRNLKVIAPGQEELLAIYLTQINKDGEHDFILPKEDLEVLVLEEGFWEDFLESPQYKSQYDANKISYAWDRLIETFNRNIFSSTQHYVYPEGIANQEKIVRFLAREPRTRRRMLAKALGELMRNTKWDKFALRVVGATIRNDPYYVFMLFPHYDYDEEEYRIKRREVLYRYCLVTKLKFQDAESIIGFSTEPGSGEIRSEDLIYYNCKAWSNEDREEAENLSKNFGLLSEIKIHKSTEFEFPTETIIKKRRRRSGKKKS
ncbi:MAG: hypothetical protein HZB50_02275 [Chloroflexi bacterium]|nr:hypothetical protein [Chloroflexota bacterium]